jgi:hypothetical protein
LPAASVSITNYLAPSAIGQGLFSFEERTLPPMAELPIIVNQYGMFRADAWADMQKAAEQKAAQRADALDGFTKEQRVRAVFDGLSRNTRLDATQTDFVARQLLHVMAQVKNVIYPGDILEQAFPINQEGGPGAAQIAYQMLDLTGEFKLVASTGTDLPEVGSNIQEYPKKVGVYGATFGWTQQELEQAGFARLNLSARKQMAVGLAAKKTKNNIAWTGDPNGADINGLFDATLNPVTIAGTWASATADAILADMLEIINEPKKDTEDFEADTVVMDTTSYSYMNKPRATTADTSIGRYILNNTSVKAILTTSYLNSVTSSTNSLTSNRVILAYPKSPMVLEFMLPRDVQQLPVQQHLLEYVVPVLFNTAGTFVYYQGTGGPIAFAVPS